MSERPDYPWTIETMRTINALTPSIAGKAFNADWFLLRQRFEEMEDRARKVKHMKDNFGDTPFQQFKQDKVRRAEGTCSCGHRWKHHDRDGCRIIVALSEGDSDGRCKCRESFRAGLNDGPDNSVLRHCLEDIEMQDRPAIEKCAKFLCYRCAEEGKWEPACYEPESQQWMHLKKWSASGLQYDFCIADRMRQALIGTPSKKTQRIWEQIKPI